MDTMLLRKMCELQEKKEAFALATIIRTQGSTPRKAGAAMVVLKDGQTWGTIGGGCGEAAIRQKSLLALDCGKSQRVKVDLSHTAAAEEGMVCGGIMEVFIKVFCYEFLV